MKRQTDLLRDIDWFTIGLFVMLALFGWFNVYAAVYDEQHASIFSLSQLYGKQMLWLITAIVLALIICLLDVRFFTSLSYPAYIICIFSLMVVLVIGHTVKSSQSWFQIAGQQVQPAEFAKIAVSLALAKFIGNYNGRLMDVQNIVTAIFIILLPFGLILLQPDVGSALVYFAFIIVLYREGLPPSVLFFGFVAVILFILSIKMQDAEAYLTAGVIICGFIAHWIKSRKTIEFLVGFGIVAGLIGITWLLDFFFFKSLDLYHIILGVILAVAPVFLILSYIRRAKLMRAYTLFILGAVLFIYSVDFVFDRVLSNHHQDRILTMLRMSQPDPLGKDYNIDQSKIAIGSGGLTGKGFLQGTQTKYNFVPEQSTDFIFCTVGEEWGFAGSAVIIMIFITLLVRMVFLAERQRSVFSRVYCYCVFSIFFIHLVVNISMTVGFMPVIGIPLPFFSYGGSSLWTFTILLFIMLRLDAARGEYIR